MTPYEQGRLAWLSGSRLDDNPYNDSEKEWDEWDRGFLDVAESPEWRTYNEGQS